MTGTKTETVESCATVSTMSGVTFTPEAMTDSITGETRTAYRYTKKSADGRTDTFLLCSALSVVSRFMDADGAGFGRIVAFRDEYGNAHRVQILDKWSADEVTRALKDEGLQIYAYMRPNLYKNCLLELISRYPLDGSVVSVRVRQPGWIDGTAACFVMPCGQVKGECVRKGRRESPELFPPAVMDKWRQGSTEEWFKNVAGVAIKSRAMITAMGFALTGPLMPFAGINTCFMHFKGESRTGKSNIARVAVSMWGSAVQGAGLMQTWNMSDAALERRLTGANQCVLALDEIKVKGSKGIDVPGLVYFVANETPRGLAQVEGGEITLRKLLSWRLPVISTGEVDLASLARERLDAGVSGRFAQIDACPAGGYGVFDPGEFHSNDEAMLAAENLQRACETFYGRPASIFLNGIIHELETKGREEFSRDLQERMTQIRRRLSDSNDSQVCDMLRRFALSEIALLKAVTCGALPEEFTPEKIRAAIQWAANGAMQEFFGSEKQVDQDMDKLRQLYPQHRMNFILLVGDDFGEVKEHANPPTFPVAGYAFFPRGKYRPIHHDVGEPGAESKRLMPDELYLYTDVRGSPVLRELLDGRSINAVFEKLPDSWKIGRQEKNYAGQKRFNGRNKLKGAVNPGASRMLAIKIQYG